jgi:two-component system phosphate regulon response regulator PhoB
MVQNVVVVDDDPGLLELIELMLTSQGDTVFPCADVRDAVELIRRVLPAVVLLDLQTSGDREAGLVVLAQLRADKLMATIPVILMSADHGALTRHAARLRALGATSLRKPFYLDRLCQMVQQAAA